MSRQSDSRSALEELKRPRTCLCCKKRLRVMNFPRQRLACGDHARIKFCISCMDALNRGRLSVRSTQAVRVSMLCKSSKFRLFLDMRVREQRGMSAEDLPDGTHNEQDALDAIWRACGVSSHGDLDLLPEASMLDRIERSFKRWAVQQQEQRKCP